VKLTSWSAVTPENVFVTPSTLQMRPSSVISSSGP
jgi:hypothetical protein